MDIREKAGVIVINSVCVSTFFVLLLCSAILVSFGSYSILESYFSFPFLAGVIWLNWKKRYHLSRFLITYFSQVVIFLLALSDRRTGSEYFLITVACLAAFVYKSNKQIALAFVMTCVFFSAYTYIDNVTPFKPDPSINYPVTSTLMLFICCAIILLQMSIFHALLHKYSASLDEANLKLTDSNNELNQLNESLDLKVKDRTEELEIKHQKLGEVILELNMKNDALQSVVSDLGQRNYEMNQLIYHLSHSLKSPVSSIAGLCNLMQLDGGKKNLEKTLPMINEKIREMNDVFNSINHLALINFESFDASECSISKILDDAVLEVSILKIRNPISLFIEPFDVTMKTDETLIYLIFYHIIKNAFMFQSNRDDSQLRIYVDELSDFVKLTFKDNGIGIPTQYQDQVYDMFFKASEISTGIGMGLYVTRRIVQRLKGNLQLLSNETGTTIVISLPKESKIDVEN